MLRSEKGNLLVMSENVLPERKMPKLIVVMALDRAEAALRDWLIGHGYLELPEGDNNDD